MLTFQIIVLRMQAWWEVIFNAILSGVTHFLISYTWTQFAQLLKQSHILSSSEGIRQKESADEKN